MALPRPVASVPSRLVEPGGKLQATRGVSLSPKLCLMIYQESEKDRYIIRKAMMLGVQIYAMPRIILHLADVALDYVVIWVPRGAS